MAAMRFEHSIDFLIERKEQLNAAYHTLLNQPCRNDEDAAELQSIDRQIIDIEDTLNNLYAIREFCPSRV